MVFPHRLRREISPEALIILLNKRTWGDGGKFGLVTPDRGLGNYNMDYVIYLPCDDLRFAVSIACFFPRLNNKIHCVKAECNDLSSFVTDLKLHIIENLTGEDMGAYRRPEPKWPFVKKLRARKLARRLGHELREYLTEQGLW